MRGTMWQVMMEVMQLTSAWDALTSRICDAVLNTWFHGSSTLRSKRPSLAGMVETGQKILRWLNPIKSRNLKHRSTEYLADVEKGMKIDWLGILQLLASTAGTILASKKAEERVERWVTSDVLHWLVGIDEKVYLGLFAQKRVTGQSLLRFSNYEKLQAFVDENNGVPCPASPRPALHIARVARGRGAAVCCADVTLARLRQSGPGTSSDAMSCACVASQSASWPWVQRGRRQRR